MGVTTAIFFVNDNGTGLISQADGICHTVCRITKIVIRSNGMFWRVQ